MIQIPFCDISRATQEIREDLDDAYRRVMDQSSFILGDEVARFEDEFAAFCGASHCVGVGNGLDALSLSLRALGIGTGDEVLVPGQTFIATWLAVTAVGATPVGVDVDPATWSMDPDAAAACVSARTAAIVPVHLFGHPADMAPLEKLAGRAGLVLVEDAAQAHGAMVGARRTGSLGQAAGFSFYPTKNLGAYGDGGAVVTSDSELARRVRQLRNYGSSSKYKHDVLGTNSRLDELQAALLRVKLRHLDHFNTLRTEIAEAYTKGFVGSDIRVISPRPGTSSAWHLFVVNVERRDTLADHLRSEGISTLVHYPVAPHQSPAYAGLGRPRSLPEAERSAKRALSLPMFPGMTLDEVARVIEATLRN